MMCAEAAEKLHRILSAFENFPMLGRIVGRTVEGNRNDRQTALGGFPLDITRCDAVFRQNLRILREPESDESGIAHDIQDVGKSGTGIAIPQIGTKRPADVLVGWQTSGGLG